MFLIAIHVNSNNVFDIELFFLPLKGLCIEIMQKGNKFNSNIRRKIFNYQNETHFAKGVKSLK